MGHEREAMPAPPARQAAPAPQPAGSEPAPVEAAGNRAIAALLRAASAPPGDGAPPGGPPEVRSQGAGPLDRSIATSIADQRGGGSLLPDPVREQIEYHLGVDLSPVRVHTDAAANRLSESVQAEAFTSGTDVFFAAGRYDPGSRGGLELLAHELTHVAQQAPGPIGNAGQVSHPDDPAEVQAREVASRIAGAPPTARLGDGLLDPTADDASPGAEPGRRRHPDESAGPRPDPDGLMEPAADDASPSPSAEAGPAGLVDLSTRPDRATPGPAAVATGVGGRLDAGTGATRPGRRAAEDDVEITDDDDEVRIVEDDAVQITDDSDGDAGGDGDPADGGDAGAGDDAGAGGDDDVRIIDDTDDDGTPDDGDDDGDDDVQITDDSAAGGDGDDDDVQVTDDSEAAGAARGARPLPPAAAAPAAAAPAAAVGDAEVVTPDSHGRVDAEQLLAAPPPPVPALPAHRPDPGVAGWKHRSAQAIHGIKPPDLRKIKAGPAKLQAAAAQVQQKNAAAAVPELAANNQQAVPKQPTPEPPVPATDPPLPDVAALLKNATEARLPDQTVPQLGPSPDVVNQTYQVSVQGLLPGQLPAPPPAAAADVTIAAPAPVDDVPGQQMEQARQQALAPPTTDPQPSPPAAPVTLHDAGPAKKVELSPATQADLTAALALLKVGVQVTARGIVRDALRTALPHEVLLHVAPQLGTEEQAGLEQELDSELDGIAAEAGLQQASLDRTVNELRASVSAEANDARQEMAGADATARSTIQANAQDQQSKIAGVGTATSAQIDQTVQAATGTADPAFANEQAEQLLKAVSDGAQTALASLKMSQQRREHELADWAAKQSAAADQTATAQAKRIRAAFESSSYKPSESPAEAEQMRRQEGLAAAVPTVTWVRRSQAAAADTATRLKAQLAELFDQQLTKVTRSRDEAATQVQAWRDKRLGVERTWWDLWAERSRLWAQQAAHQNEVWKQVRDRETAAQAASDVAVIANVHRLQDSQNSTELIAMMGELDSAQRTVAEIVRADGSAVQALAAGTFGRIAAHRVAELAERLRAKALNLTEWRTLEALGAAQNPEFNATTAAIEVHASVDGAGTKEAKLWAALGDRTPVQILAIKLRYQALYGRELIGDVYGDTDEGGDERARADALLASDPVGAAVAEFHDNLPGRISSGDLADTERMLRGKTPAQLQEFSRRYQKAYQVTPAEDLRQHVIGMKLVKVQALLAGDTAGADAITLSESVRQRGVAVTGMGPAGTFTGFGAGADNAKGAVGVLDQIRAEVEADATRLGMTTAEVDAEVRRRYKEVTDRYGTLVGGGAGAFDDAVGDQLSDNEAARLRAQLAGNQFAADAWQVKDSLESRDYKAANETLIQQRQYAARGARSDLEARFDVAQRTEDWGQDQAQVAGRQAALQGQIDTETERRAGLYTDATRRIAGSAVPTPQQPVDGLPAHLLDAMPRWVDQGALETHARLSKNGKLPLVEEVNFAIRSRNEDAIRRLLRDPAHPGKLRSKAELDRLRADYQALTKQSFDDGLDYALSGRAAFDLSLDARGEPATEKERLDRLHEKQQWEQENTGSVGPIRAQMQMYAANAKLPAEDRRKLMTDEERALDVAMQDADQSYAELDALRYSELGVDPKTAKLATEAFHRQAGGVEAAIEDQRRSVDAAAEIAAMVVGAAAGIIVIVVTGGAGTAALALAAAATDVTSIAVKRYLLGAAYGRDQFEKDLALTAVDVAGAVLTAGTANFLLRSSVLAGAVRAGGAARFFATAGAGAVEAGLAGVPRGMTEAVMHGALDSDDPLAAILGASVQAFTTGAAIGTGVHAAGAAIAHGAGGHASPGHGSAPHAPAPPAAGRPAGAPGAPDAAFGITPQLREAQRMAGRPVAFEPAQPGTLVTGSQTGSQSAGGPAQPAAASHTPPSATQPRPYKLPKGEPPQQFAPAKPGTMATGSSQATSGGTGAHSSNTLVATEGTTHAPDVSPARRAPAPGGDPSVQVDPAYQAEIGPAANSSGQRSGPAQDRVASNAGGGGSSPAEGAAPGPGLVPVTAAEARAASRPAETGDQSYHRPAELAASASRRRGHADEPETANDLDDMPTNVRRRQDVPDTAEDFDDILTNPGQGRDHSNDPEIVLDDIPTGSGFWLADLDKRWSPAANEAEFNHLIDENPHREVMLVEHEEAGVNVMFVGDHAAVTPEENVLYSFESRLGPGSPWIPRLHNHPPSIGQEFTAPEAYFASAVDYGTAAWSAIATRRRIAARIRVETPWGPQHAVYAVDPTHRSLEIDSPAPGVSPGKRITGQFRYIEDYYDFVRKEVGPDIELSAIPDDFPAQFRRRVNGTGPTDTAGAGSSDPAASSTGNDGRKPPEEDTPRPSTPEDPHPRARPEPTSDDFPDDELIEPPAPAPAPTRPAPPADGPGPEPRGSVSGRDGHASVSGEIQDRSERPDASVDDGPKVVIEDDELAKLERERLAQERERAERGRRTPTEPGIDDALDDAAPPDPEASGRPRSGDRPAGPGNPDKPTVSGDGPTDPAGTALPDNDATARQNKPTVSGDGPTDPAGTALPGRRATDTTGQTAAGGAAMPTSYPWQGVIASADVVVTDRPDIAANPTHVVQPGTRVKVVAARDGWLAVEIVSGPKAGDHGYVVRSAVDDAVAHSMEELVGTKLAWKPSGASADSVFSVWASAPKETPFPALTEATTMNCWEAIFLAAHRSGVLSWQWIHDLYTKGRPLNEWVNAMTAGARQRYKPYARGTPAPARGDLVFMDGTAHIMLATGRVSPNGTEVLSFWPPPDAPIMTDLKGVPTASPDRVKVTTIEEVVMWWTHGLLDQVVVEFGRPAWY